jgi:hypothetical protein
MHAASPLISGSQELVRKLAASLFAASLFTLTVYFAGTLNAFSDDSLALLLNFTGYGSAAVIVSAGIHALVVLFAFLTGKQARWRLFLGNLLLGFASGIVLLFASFVLVVHGGLSVG